MTADELDYLHRSQGTPERKRRTKRASARRDRRQGRIQLTIDFRRDQL